MTRKGGGTGSIAWVVLGITVLVFVVGSVLLDIDRAWPIARDAAMGVAVDPFLARAEEATGLPVVELRYAEGNGTLTMGRSTVPVRVVVDGEELLLDIQQPMDDAPYARMALRAPATVDGMQGQMALWLAGLAGAPVAGCAPVLARVNGTPDRLLEWCEVVGPDMEQVRGLSPLPVQVGATVPVPAWGGAAGFSGRAARSAQSLDRALADTLLTAYALRDTIAAVVDLDAYLRLLAGWELLGRTPAQCVWVYTERTHRFMPVLVHAVLHADTVVTTDEGLAAVVLADAGWAAQRDGHARTASALALEGERYDRLWAGHLKELAAMPTPSRGAGGSGELGHVEPSRAMRTERAMHVRALSLERLRNMSNTSRP